MCAPRPLLAALLACAGAAAPAQERRNRFNDPFERATCGLRGCPVPEGPLLTEAAQQREAHDRIERGTTGWLEEKCDEPNACKRDAEIDAAAVAAIRADPALRDTRVRAITRRKFVFVQGCVHDRAQIRRIAAAVKADPRVEYVGDEVLIGTRGKPPYRTAALK